MNESLAFHLLNSLPGCGAKTIRFLVGHFGSAEAAWEVPDEVWRALGQPRLATMAAARTGINTEEETTRLEASQITVIPFTDPNFPTLLAEIPDAPALLYARGKYRTWNTDPLIAIVGSRKSTQYGRQVTEELARALAHAGYTIVSGLAFGIDGIAHAATLEAEGQTLAVLGSGIDDASLSPQSHLRLAHDIIETGALLSEFGPGTTASIGTFPARNRIMAGLCCGTIVVEAAEDSGSLITARLALDYNREVFAVPGSIFSPASSGTHLLLKQGAKLVTGIQDILSELEGSIAPAQEDSHKASLPALDPDEQSVYDRLSHEGLHIDNLIAAVRLETMRVNMILTKLELRGLAKNIGNMHYTRGR